MKKPTTKSFSAQLTLFMAFLSASSCTWAASDAGAMIRRFQEETWQRVAPKSPQALPDESELRSPSAAAKASTERVHVSAFSVQGVTQFTESDISAVLKPYVGKELNTAEIHAAADALNKRYREAGYFAAKVFIPPQQVAGVISLEVYEGLLDQKAFEVINHGKRIKSSIVEDILEAQIPRNEPMRRADFERALLIAEDLPGITTSSLLYPGEVIGTSRLRTTVTDLPLFSGNIDIDNFGSRATGQTRLGTTLYLNSPGRVGDQLVARLVTSGTRSNYAYLTYLRPISSYGTRMGASIDYFNYDADFVSNLGYSDGRATDVRLYVTHPVYRSRHGNLNARADLSQLRIDDRNDLQINAERKIDTVSFTLQGDDDHPWINTGLSVFDASLTLGMVDIRGNAAYVAADRVTNQTDGAFARMSFSASRLSRLSDRWSLLGKVRGQIASSNLDSSQRFYLGGGTSMSGYPVGEASGDQGGELFLELRHDFYPFANSTLTAGAFYQYGWIQTHKNPWGGWQGSNPSLQNEFSLQSAGLSVFMTLPDRWVVRGLIGFQIGNNPMADPATGRASDGRGDAYRAWFQVIRYF